MTPAAPPVRLPAPDEPEIRLVDESSRLERLPWLLPGQTGSGELAQLVVYEREQFARSRRIASLDIGQNLVQVRHTGGVYKQLGEDHMKTGASPRSQCS